MDTSKLRNYKNFTVSLNCIQLIEFLFTLSEQPGYKGGQGGERGDKERPQSDSPLSALNPFTSQLY